MSLRFRKSVKMGPLRFNLSKSGIGASAGVKGARISKKAGGGYRTTLSVPGTGVSEVRDFGGKEGTQADKSGLSKELKTGGIVAACLAAVLIGAVSCSGDAEKETVKTETAVVETVETAPVEEATEPVEEAAAPVEETTVEEVAAAEVVEATEPAPQETAQQEVTTAPEPVEEVQQETTTPTEKTVYVAASGNGKKYHYDIDCANTEVKSLTKSQAEGKGYTPCKKCAGG